MVNLSTQHSSRSYMFTPILINILNMFSAILGPGSRPLPLTRYKWKFPSIFLFCSQFDNFPLLRSVEKLGQIKRKETVAIFLTKQTIIEKPEVGFIFQPSRTFILCLISNLGGPTTFHIYHLQSGCIEDWNEWTNPGKIICPSLVKLWTKARLLNDLSLSMQLINYAKDSQQFKF